ncbi:MAG: tetratricopeptide repeat protein [Terrimonas sp.]|nr:tetratricopeptide repeat protein [Terrimonas sp.]
MKRSISILAILLLPFFINAQQDYPDSLTGALKLAKADSIKFLLNRRLSGYYEEKIFDSAIYFGEQALEIARKNKERLSVASALLSKAYPLNGNGKFGEALQCILEALAIAEDPSSEKKGWQLGFYNTLKEQRLYILSSAHHAYALLESNMNNAVEELFHYKEEIKYAEKINASFRIMVAYMNLGKTYQNMGNLDTALLYGLKADSMAKKTGSLYYNGWNLGNIGDVYFERKKYGKAKKYYYEAFDLSSNYKNEGSFRASSERLFLLYKEEKNADSCLYFAKQALNSNISKEIFYVNVAYENIYNAYLLKGQSDSASKYLQLAFKTRDSAYNQQIKNLTDFQHLSMNEQLRLRELEKERVEYQGRVRIYSLLAGLGIILIITLLLLRNNRQKKRSNRILENTLSDLKNTQSQLVHSEKMASLGELTAGIAHEIQNPLNFVNNFSEVNKELLMEIKEEIDKGNFEVVRNIAKDAIENEDKIIHHGKRADAIVKGMLQHSRSSSGTKEPTDINALVDEYLRLAYHGLRAKDKSFNATLKTNFDKTIGNINIIPQDIGRVILNLVNNAFYAVQEKKKGTGEGYQPVVALSTKKTNAQVEIIVADNGKGIPQNVLDKIFQPFFTTKPTGQGTGLGLSLSYDIIKVHGGELSVESIVNEQTKFTINLPLT